MFLYQILLFFLCAISTVECSKLERKIQKLVVKEKPARLYRLLCKQVDRKLTLPKIEKIAHAIKYKPLIDATISTRKLFNRYHKIGISKRNYFKTALFITSRLTHSLKKHGYLTPKRTGLKDTIEYDPKTKRTFVLLERYRQAYLGKGSKKRVYKSILFRPTNPKILARAQQRSTLRDEVRMHSRMEKAQGVVKTLAHTTHKEKKRKYHTIYYKLYKTGSMNKAFFKKRFSLKQISSMIHDILTGLQSFHSRNLAHRDIHARNFLLVIPKRARPKKEIDAVIADFGKAVSIKRAKGIPSQGARYYRPPEGINHRHMKGKDYFASDIYAAGCVFYHIFYHKTPSWQAAYLKSHYSLKKKKELLIKKLSAANDHRRKQLLHRQARRGLTPRKELELMILKMLQVDPQKRGTAEELCAKAKSILEKIS